MANSPKTDSYKQAEESLPPHLRPEFAKLVEDYRGVAIVYTRQNWVNYKILAALIDAGWKKLPAESDHPDETSGET